MLITLIHCKSTPLGRPASDRLISLRNGVPMCQCLLCAVHWPTASLQPNYSLITLHVCRIFQDAVRRLICRKVVHHRMQTCVHPQSRGSNIEVSYAKKNRIPTLCYVANAIVRVHRLSAVAVACEGGQTAALEGAKDSDTGNRTPGYRVRGDNVSHYTISDGNVAIMTVYVL